MSATVDVLVPTYGRPSALAVTLTSLAAQTFRDFRLVVSDQSEREPSFAAQEVRAVVAVLELQGRDVELHRHLPRRGMAEQRDFLLGRASGRYALFLDDDLLLEPDVVERLVAAIREERCGFVGCAPIGLSYRRDVRPEEQAIELWEGPVEPEEVRPDTAAWERYKLHNAANVLHVQEHLGRRRLKYRVAWIGGCVLYDAAKLRHAGGFSFWAELPEEHAGEDVAAQLHVMARHGGCGLLPSGVYHLELPTTVRDRRVDAPRLFTGRRAETTARLSLADGGK